ncbi:uncharacterized protein [Centruroides vittatus]|uniref:uncharacterized protein n=1 Tax=Centruroides vittatus TaxID=120091 RepID=UPI00350F9E9E
MMDRFRHENNSSTPAMKRIKIAPTPKLENISKYSYNSTFKNTETFLNNKMLDVITISDDENSDSINISNNKPVCYDTVKSSSKISSASTKESDFVDIDFQTSFKCNKRLTALEERENLFFKERSVCSKENKSSTINLNQFLTDKVEKKDDEEKSKEIFKFLLQDVL